MGERVSLTAEDGHRLGAYRSEPVDEPRAGVIVLQEIFGVNAHIRDVCDRFSAEGYRAVAPALYDRSSRRDVELGYTKSDATLGKRLREEFSWDDTVKDVEAARSMLADHGLAVGAVGYCWGGTISFLAAARLDIQAAVVYYGGQILPYVDETERCPLLMHFGAQDGSIPADDVERIRSSHPDAEIHVYDADHGFNCDRRSQYDETPAKLARDRTLDLFERCLS